MFNLSIATDNAAFDEDPRTEICRILRVVARRLEDADELEGRILDINGNAVGTFKLETSET